MKKRYLVPFLALLAAAGPATAQSRLTITGSSTVAPVAADMAKSFEQAHPGVTITVEAGGSGRGIADARSGKADIGMVSRALTAEEKKDLFAITIARDGVVFVVHRDNPVRAITRQQAVGIYQGGLANWKTLGGRDAPIRAVTRTAGRSSLDIVAEYLEMKPAEMRAPLAAGDNDEVVSVVLGERDAIGFLSFGFALESARRGKGLRLLALEGVAPTAAELRAGRYPLARPLSFVTRGVPKGAALEFLRYAQSPAARAAITAHDFVPHLPLSQPAPKR